MYRKISQTLLLCAFFCLLSSNLYAQKNNLTQQTLNVSKKATVIIVGTSAKFGYKATKYTVSKTAKFGYKATKFTASKVAKPIIVKSAPKAGKFVLKQSGKVVKTSFPVAKKLFIKYVKYKFFP